MKNYFVLGTVLAAAVMLNAAQPELVTPPPVGVARSTGAGHSMGGSFSADGRFVLYASSADDITIPSPAGFFKVLLRDNNDGSTRLVSGPQAGGRINGDSAPGGISGDNRFVVFESSAKLSPYDTNSHSDIYLRDLTLGTTEVITSGNGPSTHPLISNDGAWVVFESQASDLVIGDNNGSIDLFARRRSDGATISLTGDLLAGPITSYAIAADSSAVLFNQSNGLIIRNLKTGAVTVLNDALNTAGNYAGSSLSWNTISRNSRYVFVTAATDLLRIDLTNFNATVAAGGISTLTNLPGEFLTPSISDDGLFAAYVSGSNVYRWNAASGQSEQVDVGNADGTSDTARISHNGRYVAFISDKSGIAQNVTVSGPQLYIRDMTAGAKLVSRAGTAGVSDLGTANPIFSADDLKLLFETATPELAANDSNRASDIFSYSISADSLQLVSATGVNGATAAATGMTLSRSATADGRFVAGISWAPFERGDTNQTGDVYVFDRLNQTRLLANVAASPNNAIISADGRVVAFDGTLRNGVSGAVSNVLSIRDLALGGVTNVAAASLSSGIRLYSLSQDGRFLFYARQGAYRYDRESNTERSAGTTSAALITTTADGQKMAGYISDTKALTFDFLSGASNSIASVPYMSADGSIVASRRANDVVILRVASGLTNVIPLSAAGLSVSADGKIVAFETRLTSQVGFIETTTATTNMISIRDGSFALANGVSKAPVVSADGRFIAFESWASDLVENDTNETEDVFLYDRARREITRVDAGNGPSFNPYFSGDSKILFFGHANPGGAPNVYALTLELDVLMVQSVEAMPNGPRLVWRSKSGTHYRLEFKNSLADLEWAPVGAEITAESEESSATDVAAPATRFYRVRAL
jgi:Tol biopolymer transport system component